MHSVSGQTRRDAKKFEGILVLVLSFDRFDLSHAFAMTVFGEVGGEPGANNFAHLSAGDRFAPERKHVGVVVFARVARDVDGVTGGGAHARDFVSGHRGTDAGAVDQYPGLSRTIRNRARNSVTNARVVNGAF